MANAGTLSGLGLLIQHGWPMERFRYVGYVVSADAFNFEDVSTGKRFWMTPSAIIDGCWPNTVLGSTVESRILLDLVESGLVDG